ncbi:MAG: polysaccharide deacetylase family protein [Crenarchaeota archaeon]|nr:polysaccharide deacetylase family protein [Thermoproteota archaeon]
MLRLNRVLLILDRVKLLDLAIKLKSPNLVVITYHNVGPHDFHVQTFEEPITPALIEKQVLFLLKSGYIVSSLGDALTTLAESPRQKVAAITFDDGYKGVYEYAYPILRKRRIKATLYLTAGFVRHRIAPWWEQLHCITSRAEKEGKLHELTRLISQIKGGSWRLHEMQASRLKPWIESVVRAMDAHELKDLVNTLSKNLGIGVPEDLYSTIMLDLNEIKEMVEYGFEVGGHGLWHVNLSILNNDRLTEEVKESLDFVKTLYKGIYTFAYPFGIYNDSVIEAIESSEFKAAVTLDPHLNYLSTNTYTLGRIPPYKFNLKDIASFKYLLISAKC